MPPRKAPAAADAPAPTAAGSAVTLEFLRALLRRIPGGASGGATMARVVEELVQPSTSATLASYASQHFLVPRSHLSNPTWVLVHPWDMPAADLIAALDDFATGLPPNRTHFWLSALAVSQHMLPPGTTLQAMNDNNNSNSNNNNNKYGGGGGGGGTQGTEAATAGSAASSCPPSPETRTPTPGGDAERLLDTTTSFATQLRRRQRALAGRQKAVVQAARREVVAATREAVRASRCGVLLLLGRDVRPLRRAWCLVELAEALRAGGPEAITVLPVDRDFSRADLVRQLRELDLTEAVSEAEEHDREVLAEALGIPPPVTTPPPGSARAAAAGQSAAAAAAAGVERRGSVATPPAASGGVERRGSVAGQAPSGAAARRAGGTAALGPDYGGQEDPLSAGRALVRQLQLALLLRPMDGALPARMLGSPLVDANPATSLNTRRPAAAAAAAASSTPSPPAASAASSSSTAPASAAAAASGAFTPCSFDWLWDWSPLTSWLALPPTHPHWRALLVTAGHGAGKTTAMAALLAQATRGSFSLAAACHFCSAADARSLAAGEAVRSLSYQLACASPGFGAALCKSLLELGGAGGGLALTPDGWLHGLEEVVEALLRRPLEQDADARAARSLRPATYLLLIDGLDEGPAAAAAAAAVGTDGLSQASAASSGSVPPPNCPGTFEVLRLVVDHLQHLPGVRLVLSCTAGSGAGAADAATPPVATAADAGGAAPTPPYVQPPPLIVAPRGAADASASVHLAVRQAVRPLEVPLAALRRDKYLPLALAHMLQEYVLSPELTAKELLWQARGCLAHVHILQLLVQHAAERLGPAGGLSDGTAIAAAATAAAATGIASGDGAAPAAGQQTQRPSQSPAPALAPQQQQHQQLQAGHLPPGQDVPQRPRTPPRQDQPGLHRQQGQRTTAARQDAKHDGKGGQASVTFADASGGTDPAAAAAAVPSGPAATAAASAPVPQTSELLPPPEVLALGAPNSGAGGVAVHVIPPVCRGTLADEYGVLWRVRTTELRDEAMVALVHAAAAAAAAAAQEEGPSTLSRAASSRCGKRVIRQQTISMAPVLPPPPPFAPERAARLQLIVDVLAAAQEPLEWALLARVVLSAAAHESREDAAPPRSGGSPTPPSSLGSPTRGRGGGGGGGGGTTPVRHTSTPQAQQQRQRGADDVPAVDGAGGGGDGSEWDEESVSYSGAAPGMQWGAVAAATEVEGPAAAAALRDLEWALQEGPLAGLVWVSRCGRVSIRHSSFLEWLRRAAGTARVGTAAPGPAALRGPASPIITAPAAAAAAVLTAPPPPPLLMAPRVVHGHAALARLLRQQMASYGRTTTPQGLRVGFLSSSQVQWLPTEDNGGGGGSGGVVLTRHSAEQPRSVLYAFRGGGSSSRRCSQASSYCLRHVVVHCAEGRLPTSELEAVLLDLDYWKQVLEGGYVEMVASALEHLLRTRGPHARRPQPPQTHHQHQHQQLTTASGGLMSPRTPPVGLTGALTRSGTTAAATSGHSGSGTPAAMTGQLALQSAAAAAATGAGAGAGAPAAAQPPRSRDGRQLSAATSSLIRDALLWLLQDGRRLSWRPEPLAIICSASCMPLQSPFRRLAEHLTAAAAAVEEGRPPPPLRPQSSSTSLGPVASSAPLAAPAAGASGAQGQEPLYPPCFVTAMPHPRYRSAALRQAECPHRVTGLLASPDGEVVLATGEWTSQATLVDTHSGRRTALLDAGPDAHPTALSAAAFSPSRRLLATAGATPGAITLWDPATGAPRAHLHLVAELDQGAGGGATADSTGVAVATAVQSATAIPVKAAPVPTLPTPPSTSLPPTPATTPPPLSTLPTSAASPLLSPAPLSPAPGSSHVGAGPASSLLINDAASTIGSRIDAVAAVAGSPLDATTPCVSCIRIHEPGPGACAASYGAPPGTSLLKSLPCAAGVSGAGAIVRGSLLLAAGDSTSGRVVLWAVAPDGWSAVRTTELVPPSGPMHPRGGVAWLEFLPGGHSLLVVQSCSTVIRIWNVQSKNLTATLKLPATCGEIFAVHFSPKPFLGGGGGGGNAADGGSGGTDTLFAAVCTSATELWSVERRQRVASLPVDADDGGCGAVGGRAWAESCVAFSPAGGLLATAGAILTPAPSGAARAAADAVDRCAVSLWDARSGAPVSQLRGMRGAVRALSFSPDGALLATAADADVALWSAANAMCLAVLPLGQEVMEVPAVAFGCGGAVLVAAGGAAVHTWDVQLAVAAAAPMLAAAAIAAADAAVRGRLSNTTLMASRRVMAAGADTAGGHAGRVAAVCFSPDGSLALSGGEDNTIRLWDMVRHTELLCVELPGAVLGVAWSPDGTLVGAAISNGTACVWHTDGVTSAAAAAAAAAAGGGEFARHEAARLECGDAGTTSVAALGFSDDGALLFTADSEGKAIVWSVEGWGQVCTVVPSLRAHGKAAAVGTAAAGAAGAGAGALGEHSASEIAAMGVVTRYAGVALSAGGRWVLMGCGREVLVYSIQAKRELTDRLGPHGAMITAVAASPCGRLVAVGAGTTVTLWGRPEDAEMAAAPGGASAAAATAPSKGAAGRKGAKSGGGPFPARVALLPALSEVTGLAFSADGALLAASLADGSVRAWQAGRWREVGWLTGHAEAAACVTFSPDARVLLSGGCDGRCLAWSTRDVLAPPSPWPED